jgi:hypothetical protein
MKRPTLKTSHSIKCPTLKTYHHETSHNSKCPTEIKHPTALIIQHCKIFVIYSVLQHFYKLFYHYAFSRNSTVKKSNKIKDYMLEL